MKQMNKKTKSKLIMLINLVLIAALMVVAVYAWFAVNVDNNVKMYEIEVHSDNPLQLSFDGENWSDSLDLSDLTREDGTNVLSTMKFIEVTGNGSNFLIPTLTQYENYALPDTSSTWKDAVANQDYLSFTVHMRSKDPLNIYVSSESFAEPSSTVFTGPDSENKSSAGDFSKDCIVGAVRVAAFDSAGTRKFVWIPRPDIHLKNDMGSTTFEMETGLTSAPTSNQNSFKWNNSFAHSYYIINGTTKMLTTMSSGLLTELPDTTSSEPAQTLVATLSGTPDSNGYYTGSATFTVWVEGCDTEARRALANGKFNLALMLDSYMVSE